MKTQVYLQTLWNQYSCSFKFPKTENKYCGACFSHIREDLLPNGSAAYVVKLIWKTVEFYVPFKLDKESFAERV